MDESMTSVVLAAADPTPRYPSSINNGNPVQIDDDYPSTTTKLKMSIRHLDVLSHISVERLHSSPNIALIFLSSRQQPTVMHGQRAGLTCYLQVSDIEQDAAAHLFTRREALEIVEFLERAAFDPDINMLVVHSDSERSLSAAVAWFASSVYQAKFLVQRRLDIPSEHVLGLLEAAAGVHVSRPENLVVKAGHIAHQSVVAR